MTTRAEKDVELASNLYKYRRAAKFLFGGSYVETLRPYREFIARVMKDEGLPVLRAALKIGKSIPESDAIPLMCLIAAAVDMMEEPQSVAAVRGRSDTPA